MIPARALGPGRRRHRRAHPGRERERGRSADLRVDAHHRYAAGSVRRPHRPPGHAELHDLRPLQLRRHADVPPGAAARTGGGLVQRRLWIERQSIAGAGARRHLDDLPDICRGHPFRSVARRLLHESAELRRRWRRGSRPEERAERSARSWAACRRSTSRASTPSAGIRRRRSSRRPRTWNPRATFSLSRGAHFIKFGAEFLKVSTRINDLNATVGRMNFENRFTNRAVGDLLLGLPSQLALTSFTVMDQGQNMQFYFVQDDYRLSPKFTANLGVRYEYATPPLEKDNQFANFDPVTGTMVFATDGSVFERALIHPDRNNVAPRIGFAYTPLKRMVVRGGYGVFYTHTVRQGREGLLGFNPPYLIDNLLQTSVSGAAAVASAAPFRLVNGYPSGLLDPGAIAPDRGAPRPGCQSAHALHPAVQRRRAVRIEAGPGPRRRVRRQQGHQAEWLPQSEPACRHHQPGRIAVGRRAALSELRRHPVDGEPRQLDLQVTARRAWRSASRTACRGSSATRGGRRSPARRITSRRAEAARASTPACSASRRTATTCAPSTVPRSST